MHGDISSVSGTDCRFLGDLLIVVLHFLQYGIKIFVITSFKDTCYIEILPNIQKSERGKTLLGVFVPFPRRAHLCHTVCTTSCHQLWLNEYVLCLVQLFSLASGPRFITTRYILPEVLSYFILKAYYNKQTQYFRTLCIKTLFCRLPQVSDEEEEEVAGCSTRARWVTRRL